MRFILKYLIIYIILIYCFVVATGAGSISYPVDVSVHNGEGTILISWLYPDSINVKKTSIYCKKFGSNNFKLLAVLSPEDSSYLHAECEPGTRYFYKIELEDIFEEKYLSDIERPSFGTCIISKDSSLFNKNIQSIYDLIIEHVGSQIYQEDSTKLKNIKNLLKTRILDDRSWIELFPLHILKSSQPIIYAFNNIILDQNLFDQIMDYESIYRNNFLLKPEIWKLKLEKEILRLRENWIILYNAYPNAIKLFDSLEPVKIVGYESSNLNGLTLQLYLFHPDEIDLNDFYILSDDEYINLENLTLIDEHLIVIEVPQDWKYANLMMKDSILQKCPIITDQFVTFTLEGDIIPMDTNTKNRIKVTSDRSSLYLNEIAWEPKSGKYNIELAGKAELDGTYIVEYNNELIWEIVPELEFEIQYIDSSFVIADSISPSRFISLQKINGDSSKILEYIILDTIPFAISRLHDRGPWYHSKETTFGSSNENIKNSYDTKLMPQLFVLYQNYPNPFNGKTRITFDLLEDALVTLYVTDATGRIHDKLIEGEYVTSGSYNYLWDGESRSSGIYFITIQAEVDQALPVIFSRKMIYIK